jgi:hypothetical protein
VGVIGAVVGVTGAGVEVVPLGPVGVVLGG